MLWAPRDPACTLRICTACSPRRLHVWRTPYPPETGLAESRPLARHLSHLQCASATCTARQRLLLHVGECSGPTWTRRASLGLTLHPAQGACACGAPFTQQKLALHKTKHLHAPLALAGLVSHQHRKAKTAVACRRMLWAPKDAASTLRTCAASSQRRLHVWSTPYPPETGLAQCRLLSRQLWHLEGPPATSTARQRVLLGPDHHHWDLCCIQLKALARLADPLPTRNWSCTWPGTWTAPLALGGLVSHQHHRPETAAACRQMLGPSMTRLPPLGLGLHPAQGACMCGAPLTHQKLALH